MSPRVRFALMLVGGVSVVGCADTEQAGEIPPRMVYVALSDSATGNPIPRSSLRYAVAGDSALADAMPRREAAASESDSASGNPTPRAILVTCTDDAGRSIPCQWSTTY